MNIIRESWVMKWLSIAYFVIFAGFAVTMMAIGDKVTSKQWQYLMSVPGHKWSWGLMFLMSAFLIKVGVRKKMWSTATWGFRLAGSLSLAIGGFYTLAPVLGERLLTLGMWPWFIVSVTCWGAAYLTGKPLTWL